MLRIWNNILKAAAPDTRTHLIYIVTIIPTLCPDDKSLRTNTKTNPPSKYPSFLANQDSFENAFVPSSFS